MPKRVVDVLVPVALDRAYSYRVPEALALAPGDIVSVPLGARGEATAVVWAENAKPNPRLDNRLKDVEEKLDLPPLRDELRGFVDWVANYTLASRGMVLRMCLRMGEHLGAERERTGVRLAGAAPQRMTTARARVLELLADSVLRGKSEAAREAGVSAGVVDGLIDEGTLETLVLPLEPVAEKPDPDFAHHRIHRRSSRRRRQAEINRRRGQIFGDAARRRHRLGQDRSLFRSGRRRDPRRPAKSHSHARDRAHRTIPRPLRRALRRAAGGMAFGSFAAQARAHLEGRRRAAKSRSWSAHARRCFCPTPISG